MEIRVEVIAQEIATRQSAALFKISGSTEQDVILQIPPVVVEGDQEGSNNMNTQTLVEQG